jgi:uncharacterized protein (TIGR00251 family)
MDKEWVKQRDGRFSLLIWATPGAKKSEIVGILGDALKIKLAAKPVEGEANKELIRFLAHSMGLSKQEVIFESGETSRHKRVSLPQTQNVEQFIKKVEDA